MSEERKGRPVRGRCPTCRWEVVCVPGDADAAALFPFCSERCRMADLDKWFEEEYRVERSATEADIEQED